MIVKMKLGCRPSLLNKRGSTQMSALPSLLYAKDLIDYIYLTS